jgi:hypothetical protein
MACKTESMYIGEREFSATQWNAEKSLLMKFKLLNIFGASLASMVTGSNDADSLSKGLESLFDNSSPEKILEIIKETIMGVAVDGKRMTATSFNEVFDTENLMDVYKVFIFVLKVNYGNFLKGRLGGELLNKVENL